MEGQFLEIDGRQTYFPPFVNEVFGQRPYWACTFASLLNGANVGWLGQKPATVDEIRALATASGDPDTKGGSRSRHMLTAMQVRYGKKMALEGLPPRRVQERLSKGWAMVGGVTYGKLPWHFRQPSPSFTGGHRIVLIGWDAGNQRTRILDPMQRHDHTFTGEWIKWSQFEPAWWSTEQLWFQPGGMLAAPVVREVKSFALPAHWTIKAGTIVAGRSPDDPRTILLQKRLKGDSGASFDRLVDVFATTKDKKPIGRYIRVSNGLFKGMLVDPATDGIEADTGTATGHDQAPAAPAAPAAAGPIEVARQQGRKEMFEQLKGVIDGGGSFPSTPPPG